VSNLPTRIREALRQLRYTEPALLRARVVQLVGLAVALGITVPGVVDRWIGVGFAALTILAPYYQGRKTRADVWSPATVDDLTRLAQLFPELATRARELLGQGMPAHLVSSLLEQESLAADPPGGHAHDRRPA